MLAERRVFGVSLAQSPEILSFTSPPRDDKLVKHSLDTQKRNLRCLFRPGKLVAASYS